MDQQKENSSQDERLLRLVGITYNQIESGVYALILEEVEGNRRIPIVIGYPEAQAIECKLQDVVTPRPLTHDLISMMLISLGAKVEKIVIRRLPTGVFAAYIHLIDRDGIPVKIDARSSDAIAIAIRINAPIYTSSEVIEEAGFSPDEVKRRTQKGKSPLTGSKDSDVLPPSFHKEKSDSDDRRNYDFNSMSDEQLTRQLEKCVEEENYETANEIKKILEKRKDK